MIRKEDGGSTSGGRDWANVKVNTPRRRRQERGPDSRSVIKSLLHTVSYENSDEIALAIYRDITDTLTCHRENEEYVERIRRELFLLCNYNRTLTKAEGRFPRMLSLKNVLARYVELEYIVLYARTHDGTRRSEREVEKRVRSILYMMLSNVHQQPVDHKLLHKSVLFVLQQVGTRYWAEERIVHRLNVHVFQKYGKFDAIVKIKDSREDFLIEHLRNNDPDIAYLSVDPFEDVKDFEQNVFIKIPEVNANKTNSFGPSVLIKTEKVKIEKVKSAEDEDVKQCGVILTIDLTSEAQIDEDKTNTSCSTGKQQSISDRCSEPDLSNKDLSNSIVQTVEEEIAVVKSTNDSSARCLQGNDIIVISDGDVPADDEEESVSVPNAKADVIDLTSDGEQEVQECVAQDKTSEDPVPVPAVICPAPSPPRVPSPRSPPVNRVDEICDNNEPAPIIQHVWMRSVTVNQVNEVSSSVISESDEVSRNEEVPANDGNVSSTGNSPSRNSVVPYSNGEISSTTGKLDENALIELIYRKQSDLVDNCNFENSPSQSGSVYSKKFEAEKECGISSPTNNLDLIESARVQNNDEVGKRLEEEVPIINIDNAEESTNDPCSSKQSEIASAQSDVSKSESERLAASCHQEEEHISRSLAEKERNHRNVHSMEIAEHALLLINIEALTEQIEKKQQRGESYRNLHSIKPAENDASNSPLLFSGAKSRTSTEEVQEQPHTSPNDVLDRNAKQLNVDNSLTNEFTNNQKSTLDERLLEKTDEAQIRESDAVETMMNHSECNSEANEDISLILEALINACTDEKVIKTQNIEAQSVNKPTRVIFEQIDERIFSDVIINEYNELVNRIDEYENQIVDHGKESSQDSDELKPPRNQIQFKNDDKDSLLMENSNYQKENNELQMESSLMQGIEASDAFVIDQRQLKSKPDDFLDSSFAEICVSGEPTAETQVQENLVLDLLAENVVNIEFDDQIEEESVLAESFHVEDDEQSDVQALILIKNERVPDWPTLQKKIIDAEKRDAANNENEVELRNSLSDDLEPEHDQVVKQNSLARGQEEIVGELVAEQTCNASQTDEFDLVDLQSEDEQFEPRLPPNQLLKKDVEDQEKIVGDLIAEHTCNASQTDEFDLGDLPSEDEQFEPGLPPNQILKKDVEDQEKIVGDLIAEHTYNASQTDEFDLGDLPSIENKPFKSHLPSNQVLKKGVVGQEEIVGELVAEHTCNASQTDEFDLENLPSENEPFEPRLPPNQFLKQDVQGQEKTVVELVAEQTCNESQTDEFDLGDLSSEDEQFEPRLAPNQILKKDVQGQEKTVVELVAEQTCNASQTDEFDLEDLSSEDEQFEPRMPPNQILKKYVRNQEKIVSDLIAEHTCNASQTDEFDLGVLPSEDEQFEPRVPPNQIIKKDVQSQEKTVVELVAEQTCNTSQTDKFDLEDLPSENEPFEPRLPPNQFLKQDVQDQEKTVGELIAEKTCNASQSDEFDLGDLPSEDEPFDPRLPPNQFLKQDVQGRQKTVELIAEQTCNASQTDELDLGDLPSEIEPFEPCLPLNQVLKKNQFQEEEVFCESVAEQTSKSDKFNLGDLPSKNDVQFEPPNQVLKGDRFEEEKIVNDSIAEQTCNANETNKFDLRDLLTESDIQFKPSNRVLEGDRLEEEKIIHESIAEQTCNANKTADKFDLGDLPSENEQITPPNQVLKEDRLEEEKIVDESIGEEVCNANKRHKFDSGDLPNERKRCKSRPPRKQNGTNLLKKRVDSVDLKSSVLNKSNIESESKLSDDQSCSDPSREFNEPSFAHRNKKRREDSSPEKAKLHINNEPVGALTNPNNLKPGHLNPELEDSCEPATDDFLCGRNFPASKSKFRDESPCHLNAELEDSCELATDDFLCEGNSPASKSKFQDGSEVEQNISGDKVQPDGTESALAFNSDTTALSLNKENIANYDVIDKNVNAFSTIECEARIISDEEIPESVGDSPKAKERSHEPSNSVEVQEKREPKTETNESTAVVNKPPIRTEQTSLDSCIAPNGNFATEINDGAYLNGEPPINSAHMSLASSASTANKNLETAETNEDAIGHAIPPHKSIPASLKSSASLSENADVEASLDTSSILINENLTIETNESNTLIKNEQTKSDQLVLTSGNLSGKINDSDTPIKNLQVKTDSSILTNENLITEINDSDTPIKNVQTKSDALIPTNGNLNAEINDSVAPIKKVQTKPDSLVLTNENLTAVINDSLTPNKNDQTKSDPLVLTNENLTAEMNDGETPIKNVQANLAPTVLTNENENLMTETVVGDIPIKTGQENLSASVQTNRNFMTGTNINNIPNKTLQTNLKPTVKECQSQHQNESSVLDDVQEKEASALIKSTEINESSPIINVQTSLDSSVSSNGNFATEINETFAERDLDTIETIEDDNPPMKSAQEPVLTINTSSTAETSDVKASLDSSTLTNTETNIIATPIKTVQTNLKPLALANENMTCEKNVSEALIKTNLEPMTNGNLTSETNVSDLPIETVQTNLELPSAKLFSETNVSNISIETVQTNLEQPPSANSTLEINDCLAPIENVQTNLKPSILTIDNLKTTESKAPIETVQPNLATTPSTIEHSTAAETNQSPIQTVSTDKKLEAETNGNADITEGPPIKNLAASDSFRVQQQVKPDPFMIDEKQAANVLECYKNSRNFFLMGQPDDLLYTSNEEVVSEEAAPKEKSVPSELSVLIYNPDVNKNPLNLLATAAGTRPNLEVSPSKKLERSRVKMGGGGKPCNKGGKRQRSPKAAPNMKTRTTPPRAAKNNVTLNYCDKNKRFSIRSWVERSMRYNNKTNEVVQEPPQATYNSDYNVTNDESSDSFDGLIIAEDVELPETENPIDILDENTVDNELVLVRSESAVQISIPETEEYDHQILEDLEKIETQKGPAVSKNLFGYDPSNQHLLNINEGGEKEDVPKKTKTTDHSIQSILNISPLRSKSNLDFTLYNTESDSALDLSLGKCVSYEEPKTNLVPYMFTDDGEILSLKSIKHRGVMDYSAEDRARTPTKTKAEVKEYPFVCLSRHEVADYISSQTVVPMQTKRKKNLRTHAKFKNFKSRKRMGKESKRGRKGRGVKKTKELPSHEILEDEIREIKNIIVADRKYESKVSKSAKQKEPKPRKRERANSFKSQAESEELQDTTDSDRKGNKILTITDFLIAKDVRKKGEKERNKKTKSNRNDELNFTEQEKPLTASMNEIKMTLKSKESTEKHNLEEPELKLKKKSEVVRITERRRTVDSSRGNEQQDEAAEVKKIKNEMGKNTRSTERRKSVEVKRKEQEENQFETKLNKNKGGEPLENDGAFTEIEAAVKSKKSETTKSMNRKLVERRRSEPEVKHNRSEIIKKEKSKGTVKDESDESDQNKNKSLEKQKMRDDDQEENRPQISKVEIYQKIESSVGERTALEKKNEKLETKSKIKHKTESNKQEEKEAAKPLKLRKIEAERKKEETKSSKEADILKTNIKNSRIEKKEVLATVNELEKKSRANKESEPEKSALPPKKATEVLEVKPKKTKIVKNSKKNEPEKGSESEKHKAAKNREEEVVKDEVTSKKETDKLKKNSNKRNEPKLIALLEPEKKSRTVESVENEQRKCEWEVKSKKTEANLKNSKRNEQVKDTDKHEKKSEIVKLKTVKKSKENEEVTSVKETEHLKTRSRKNEVVKNRERNEQEHSVNEPEQKDEIKNCTVRRKTMEESEQIEQENEKLKRKETEIIENIEKQKPVDSKDKELELESGENESNKTTTLVNETQKSNENENLQNIISKEEETEELKIQQDTASADNLENIMQTKNCKEENKIEIEEKLPTPNLSSDTEIEDRKRNPDLQDECKQETKPKEDDETKSESETCDLIKPNELSKIKEVESKEEVKTPDFETEENRESVLGSTEDKHPSEKTVSVRHTEVTNCTVEKNEDTQGNQNEENAFVVATHQENIDLDTNTKNSVHLTQTPPEPEEGTPGAFSSNQTVDTETPVGNKRKLPADPMTETPKKPKLSIEKLKQSLGDKLRVAETERKDAKPKQSKHKFCKIEDIISNLKYKEAHKNDSPQKATSTELDDGTKSDGATTTDLDYKTSQINPPLDGAVVIPKTQANRKILLDGVVTTLREENKSENDLKEKEKDDLANDTITKPNDSDITERPRHRQSLHTAASFSEMSFDGALKIDCEKTETSAFGPAAKQADVDTLNVNQKSPHHSPSHTVAEDPEYFSKMPLDGSVNLDSKRTETSAISSETEPACIDDLSFNQKSPRHSPSRTVAGDVKSFNETTPDGAGGLTLTTTETPAIDAVIQETDLNVLSFSRKSPRHSRSRTVSGDIKSINEMTPDGAVSLTSTATETPADDAVTKEADVDVVSFNRKSPRRSLTQAVASDVKSFSEIPLDGAVNLDSTTSTIMCAIDATTKQYTVAGDVKSFSEIPVDGAVTLGPPTTKTCAIDAVTKQVDVNDLSFNQKSPRLSPSDAIVGDLKSFSETPVDGVANVDPIEIEASVSVVSFHQKSPRHAPPHAYVADDVKSLNEMPLDGAVGLDSTTRETSVFDVVAQSGQSPRRSPSHTIPFDEMPLDGAVNLDLTPAIDDVLIKRRFIEKSPCHSTSYAAAGDVETFSEIPPDGVDSNTTKTSAIDSVTEQDDVNFICFNQKSPRHSPLQTAEGERVSSNETSGDGVVNFDDDVMETSAIDTGIKQDARLEERKLPGHSPLHVPVDGAANLPDSAMETSVIDAGVEQDDHIAICLKPGRSPLHVFASRACEMPLDGAANLDASAMETSAIDNGEKEDDLNVICLNQKPPPYLPAGRVESFSERPLDGVVNLEADVIEATKQDDHSIMSFRQGLPCPFPLHAAANDVESELPLDGAGVNVIETSAEMGRNCSVKSMDNGKEQEITVTNRKLSINEPLLDGNAKQRNTVSSPDVLPSDVILHSDSVLDAVVSTEEGSECLKENLQRELPMGGDSVAEQNGLHELRKPSLDGTTTSVEQKYDGVLHLVNEDGASVYSAFSTEQKFYSEEDCALKQNEKQDLHHPQKQMLEGAFSVEETDSRDITYYQPKENSSHKPVIDAEQNSNESLYEPLLDGASAYSLEPQVEASVTQSEVLSTENMSETASGATEQKMEKISSHGLVFPEEDLPKTMEEKLEFSFAVRERGTDASLEDSSQEEKADGVENLESTEVKKIAIASNETVDIESCYKALRDVLLDNNQKNLRANSYLECCHKQHDDFTELPKLMVAQDVVDIANSDEVKVKDPMIDCKAKRKDPTFSLYTQEEINDNSIVNPPSVYMQAKKLDGKTIPSASTSASQRITSIYTQEEINDCITHPKKPDSLNPLGHKKMLLPLPNVNSLIDSAKGMFVKTNTKQPPDFAYSNDFIDLPPSNLVKGIKRDFLYDSEKTARDKNLGLFEQNKSTEENIDNICVESLNFLPHNILHTDQIPMWRLGEVISENVDILTANSGSQQLKSGVEFDSAIQEERSASEGIWGGEQEKQSCSDKVQGSHLQAFDNPIQEEGVTGNGIDVDEIPSRKTLNPSGTIHIILEPSEHNYCLGGPLLNAKPENNALKQVDTGSLSKMKGNEQVSDGSPVDGEHIFHFSEQISSMVKNNLPTLSMEDSPVDENNDDQDEQKIFSLIENSNTFNFSQPTVMSVQKMNDVMMAIANLNSLTSAQNKKLDKQKVDFLFQQEDSISSNDSTVSNDVHSDCDFAINSIAMLRTQNTTSDSADDSDFPPHAADIFSSSPASMNVIVKHNQSDFASIDSIFSGNDFDIMAQNKTTAEDNAQSQHNTTDVPAKQPVVDGKASKKRKPERDEKQKADGKASDAKLSSIQSNILDDMLVKAMQRQNTRTRVLAAQKKVHKEKSETTSSRTKEAASQCQEKIHKDKNEESSSRGIEAVGQCQEENIHKEKNEVVTSPSAIEASQEKIQKEKNEVATSSKTFEAQEQKTEVSPQINGVIKTTPPVTILNKTLPSYPPLLLPKQAGTPPKFSPSKNKDDQPPVLTPEIQLIKFRPYEDSPGKTQYEDVKMQITSRGDELAFLQKPREDMIDSIKRRQRRPPEKYVDSVLLKVEKETQEEKFKVFEKNKIKSALSSLVKAKEKKPRKRPAEDESSNDSSKSVKLRAKLIECSDYDENTSSDDFYRNKRKKMLKASELSDSSASDTDLEIKIRKERRMTSEERDALFFKVRDGKDYEEQKKSKPQQDAGGQKQVRFNLQQPTSTEIKQKKSNVQGKPQQDSGGQAKPQQDSGGQAKPSQDSGGQKQVRFNLQQPVCPSTETKSEKYKQYKNPDAPVKGYYTSSYAGQQQFRTRPDYRDRHIRVPNGGSQSSRCPSYPSQPNEQIYRSRSRSPLMKFGNSSERRSGFQDYRVYTNSQGVPFRNSRSHPGARNVDLPTLLSHYSQIHRASNSSTEWSKNVSGIGTPLPNVSFQAPPNTSKDSSKRT